ncbi:cytidylate kinase [Solidesulfovibrio carbinoliphilus subsp. oakridgensis]|uniref:Cytidylate kinase n=1 Tax=Solidesulfovibrio carbinoliphilus subsp. oakridgensis TaxID=694327 RepID=G7Q6P5_9BACT|nr:(d)CMP kinase [Solidesulfovibrio carbinoliphilus]EHJ47980.1 cytidylate kinase [Solidesulfovibrio carbinoliphilus subsp. oakridgensis]
MAVKAHRIVTIDGPAGAGKTSVSRRAAGLLGLAYLDTGAMFRALALRLGPEGHELPEAELDARLGAMVFSLAGSGADTTLLVDGAPLPDAARTEQVGAMASNLAVLPVVRRRLRLAQQALGRAADLLAEGRDMGTVVFPEAGRKFFLDASPEVRAARRVGQLAALGRPADYAEILRAIRRRDDQDRNRAASPLVPAADALVIDTSLLTEDAVVARIVEAAGG